MAKRRFVCLAIACVIAGAVVIPGAHSEEESAATGKDGGLSVEVARYCAKVMQDVYRATLAMLHDRYFHRDKSVLPRARCRIFFPIFSVSQTSRLAGYRRACVR